MAREFKYIADDKKEGMTIDELSRIIDTVASQTLEGYAFRLRATVGFKSQIQTLTFTEVKKEPSSELPA